MYEREPATVARAALRRAHGMVLVIDDCESDRLEICRLLRRDGYEAIPSRQGPEAAWYLQRYAERLRLVITDLLPPAPDGYHLGIPFGAVQPHTPVLFTARLRREEAVRRGLLHSRAPYLPKPFPPTALARAVTRTLVSWPRRPAA